MYSLVPEVEVSCDSSCLLLGSVGRGPNVRHLVVGAGRESDHDQNLEERRRLRATLILKVARSGLRLLADHLELSVRLRLLAQRALRMKLVVVDPRNVLANPSLCGAGGANENEAT